MATRENGKPKPPQKISFKYLKYTIQDKNTQVERRKGATYKVSPYKLLINEGNYYLLAYDNNAQDMRTYRVDRMKEVKALEEGTEIPLEGAVFDVEGPDGNTIGSFSSGPDGTVTIPVERIGSYVVTEVTPPKHHLFSEKPTQTVSVSYGRVAIVTYENAPYGNLRVEKVSDTGDQLSGVTVQIKAPYDETG